MNKFKVGDTFKLSEYTINRATDHIYGNRYMQSFRDWVSKNEHTILTVTKVGYDRCGEAEYTSDATAHLMSVDNHEYIHDLWTFETIEMELYKSVKLPEDLFVL